MLPYLKLQLLYVGTSGAATLAVWWLAGRAPRLAQSLRWRAAVSALALALFSALILITASLRIGPIQSRFMAVAHAYYSAAFWLPAVLLFELARRRKERRADPLLAFASVALIAGGLYALLIEPNRMQLVERSLRFSAWPERSPPLRIAHISDLQTVGVCERERRAAEAINAWEPDLVVFTGDYVAGPLWAPEPAIEAARAFLASLRPRLGIVCVSGHSETEAIRRRVFEGLDGILYLNNEEHVFELSDGHGPRKLRVHGITARNAELDRLEARYEAGLVTLAVSHVPDVTYALEGRGVDLHLAGHTHGGQIALPFLGPPMTLSHMDRKYARGLHLVGDHWLQISPGIGMEGSHAPRIRFLCPPEIDFLVLQGGESAFPVVAQPSRG